MALCHFFSLLLLLLAVVGDGYLIVCNLLWREFTLFPLLTSGWWVEGEGFEIPSGPIDLVSMAIFGLSKPPHPSSQFHAV